MIFEGEQVAGDVQIAAVVAAGQSELRLRIRRLAAADDDRADRSPARKPGTLAAGVPGVGSPVKKYPAREKPKRAVLSSAGEKTCVSCRLKPARAASADPC